MLWAKREERELMVHTHEWWRSLQVKDFRGFLYERGVGGGLHECGVVFRRLPVCLIIIC